MSMTWSPKVAMTKEEVNSFLSEKLVARVATIRKDGTVHITPLWYLWDGESLYFILGAGERPRQHIRNLERNPNVSVIIDRDLRPETGKLELGAQAVLIRGKAELIRDERTQEEVTRRLLARYFGEEVGERLLEPVLQDGKPGKNRVVVRVKPEKITAWDFRKLY